ncbi:hypothetical protein ACJX0J_031151, partial [Zea mays]
MSLSTTLKGDFMENWWGHFGPLGYFHNLYQEHSNRGWFHNAGYENKGVLMLRHLEDLLSEYENNVAACIFKDKHLKDKGQETQFVYQRVIKKQSFLTLSSLNPSHINGQDQSLTRMLKRLS